MAAEDLAVPKSNKLTVHVSFRNRANVPRIEFSAGRFLVKIADTEDERRRAFALRRSVFENDYRIGHRRLELSHDFFDDIADLLIIKNQSDDEIVGTHRIICSNCSERFGNDAQFDLTKFLQVPGTKVEICLASIHPKFRQGTVISLLWRGIFQYVSAVEATYLFGAVSFPFIGPAEVFSIISYLRERRCLDDRYDISPLAPYDHSLAILKGIGNEPSVDVRDLISPPCRAYLNAGATLVPVPAYDPQLACYDFFSILDIKQLKASHARHFSK